MAQDESKIIALLRDPATRRSGFTIVVQQYGEMLYWHVRRIVLTHDDADDVLQNVFLKAWECLDSFRNDSKLSTWLYRIAVNESLDFLRRHKKEQSVTALPADDSCQQSVAQMLIADSYFDGDETQAMLQEAIAALPDVQRMVFTMRYFDGIKYSEMSSILGTSEGALKASYHIAVKKISEYFNSHD